MNRFVKTSLAAILSLALTATMFVAAPVALAAGNPETYDSGAVTEHFSDGNWSGNATISDTGKLYSPASVNCVYRYATSSRTYNLGSKWYVGSYLHKRNSYSGNNHYGSSDYSNIVVNSKLEIRIYPSEKSEALYYNYYIRYNGSNVAYARDEHPDGQYYLGFKDGYACVYRDGIKLKFQNLSTGVNTTDIYVGTNDDWSSATVQIGTSGNFNDGGVYWKNMTYVSEPYFATFLHEMGDVNADAYVNSLDALLLRQRLLKITTSNNKYSDLNKDGKINSTDLLIIKQLALSLYYVKPLDEYVVASSDEWMPTYNTSQTQCDEGLGGGEGGQRILEIDRDKTDGNFCLFGNDWNTIYRSTDGGRNWSLANNGFQGIGVTGIAIDPRNKNRAVFMSYTSQVASINGMYLTTNQGESWTQVLTANEGSTNDMRHDEIVYDPTSYNSTLGYCTTIYWSSGTNTTSNLSGTGYLYKSTDGGYNWSTVNTSTTYADSSLFVNPTNGNLYALNSNGLYRSTNGGSSFSEVTVKTSSGTSVGVPRSMCVTASGYAYMGTSKGILRCTPTSNYATGTVLAAGNLSSTAFSGSETLGGYISVSDVDENYIILGHTPKWSGSSSARYYSHDGGATFFAVSLNTRLSFILTDTRPAPVKWSPVDRENCISVGGDYMTISNDGGSVFNWANSGVNNAAITNIVANVTNQNLVIKTNQDYNLAVSFDGGATCKYINSITRFSYGGYMLDENTWIVGSSENWSSLSNTYLSVTRDGGKTWSWITDSNGDKIVASGRVTGSVLDPNTVFYGSQVTRDRGVTWSSLGDVKNVCDQDLNTGTLYAYGGTTVYKSTDIGVTWTQVTTTTDPIKGLAYSTADGKLYFMTNTTVFAYNTKTNLYVKSGGTKLPKDAMGKSNYRFICTDHIREGVVYVSNSMDYYKSEITVLRSIDGANTFANLTPGYGTIPAGGPLGPLGAKHMYVNNQTGELITYSWKIGPPADVPSMANYMQTRTYNFGDIAGYYKTDGRSYLTTLSGTTTKAISLENGADCITIKADCKGDVAIDVQFTSKKSYDQRGFVRAYVDGVDQGRVEVPGSTVGTAVRSTVTVATGLSAGVHTIKIYRAVENTIGIMRVVGFNINGTLLNKAADSNLYIEFFGDSITAGYGDLISSGDSVDGGNGGSLASDSTITYAFKTAQNLGADISAVAASGTAFTTGLGTYPVSTLYNQRSFINTGTYDFSRTADIVVISLGTNDYSLVNKGTVSTSDLTAAAVSLMQLVKTKNPNAKVIWAYGMMGKSLKSYIQAAVTQMGEGFYYFETSSSNYSGGGSHPSASAHTSFATQLTNFINNNVLN